MIAIVIGGVPTLLEIHFMCLFMSHPRILLQRSGSMNLFDPIRYQMDRQKVEVSIRLLGHIYLMADPILLRVHFASLLGWRPSFIISFVGYLSLHLEFGSQGIGCGLCLISGSPD
jgi:hypothetical protein